MLKPISGGKGVCVTIGEAVSMSPFDGGLEYYSPARGTWNIVHTGMLIPEAHEIFVCAAGCLRGVVLTAAEMNAMDRFSTVEIRENNVLDGNMEEMLIEGVTDILERMEKLPPAVLIYTSCIHHFMGCDISRMYRELSKKFPQVKFTDCYMNPIMRKSGLTPDQLMRKQLYSLLDAMPVNPKSINIIGNDLPVDKSSELVQMIENAGYKLREIQDCKTFSEYMEMGEAFLNISNIPAAVAGGNVLAERLGTKHLYLPSCFGYDDIELNYEKLAKVLQIEKPDFSENRSKAENALRKAHDIIGNAPVAIDYTAFYRPLGLAKLLLEHGFNVSCVFADGFISEEERDFAWLRKNTPQLLLHSTNDVMLRTMKRESNEKTLAIGQKAAYFTGTEHFVNVVENGGMYGYDGICKLAELMIDAYLYPKDTRNLISIKGMGCGCCS